MTASFFDLVRSGAASFDAPGFAAEELTQLVHAAMDLLPPSTAAVLVAERPFLDHHSTTASWADLVAASDADAAPAGSNSAGPGGDAFDFGAGASHRDTTFDGVHAFDVTGTGDDHWPHADLFDEAHDHGPADSWDHVDHALHEDSAHDHPGLHDSVLHEAGLHPSDGGGEPGDGHHEVDDGGPPHDGGWHTE